MSWGREQRATRVESGKRRLSVSVVPTLRILPPFHPPTLRFFNISTYIILAMALLHLSSSNDWQCVATLHLLNFFSSINFEFPAVRGPSEFCIRSFFFSVWNQRAGTERSFLLSGHHLEILQYTNSPPGPLPSQ
ncbi:hypothetical protein B0H16DRAFT_1475309 [Mycena metata]|uniref:Uncharacterized protein n=1 Tax=Mycena metata TaxID=1033252 RepID=A0AAD7HFR7_9AGAR|nr:hypothetical protein B0H16DRAFT_1475309 [Mycena metata]